MRQRRLGRSGLVVSEFALGTMTFGAETGPQEAHRILDAFVAAGGTFIDTADVYARGASEEIIGAWLAGRGRRADVVLATKAAISLRDEPGPNDAGLSRRYLTAALDASLTRLGVEQVDLLQTHLWDPLTPLEETIGTLAGFVQAGKVGYIGVSNVTGWQLERCAALAAAHHLPIVSLQPQYNLLERGAELELVPVCLDRGIGLLPWSPLAGGWLTGKYARAQRPTGATRLGEDPDRGVEAYDRRNTPATWRVLDALYAAAEAAGTTMTRAALRWVTDRPAVTSTILGVRDLAQLHDNLAATTVTLDADTRAALDAVSAPPVPPYPYGFIDELTAPRRIRG